jgi:ribosome-associated translation inhibitor RaiA
VFKKQNHNDKRNYQVSVEVMVPGKVLFGAHYAETFETALADAFSGVSHQLRRFKEELNVHQ